MCSPYRTLPKADDPGLPRRFPLTLNLADYSPEELVRIAMKVAKAKFGAAIDADVNARLERHFATTLQSEIKQHNGGLAVRVVEAAVEAMADRLADVVVLAPKRHWCAPDATYTRPTKSLVKACGKREHAAQALGLPMVSDGTAALAALVCTTAARPAEMRAHMRRGACWSTAFAEYVGVAMHDVLTPSDFGLTGAVVAPESAAEAETSAAAAASDSGSTLGAPASPAQRAPRFDAALSPSQCYSCSEDTPSPSPSTATDEARDDDGTDDWSDDSGGPCEDDSDYGTLKTSIRRGMKFARLRFARLLEEQPGAAHALLDTFAKSRLRQMPLHSPLRKAPPHGFLPPIAATPVMAPIVAKDTQAPEGLKERTATAQTNGIATKAVPKITIAVTPVVKAAEEVKTARRSCCPSGMHAWGVQCSYSVGPWDGIIRNHGVIVNGTRTFAIAPSPPRHHRRRRRGAAKARRQMSRHR